MTMCLGSNKLGWEHCREVGVEDARRLQLLPPGVQQEMAGLERGCVLPLPLRAWGTGLTHYFTSN